MKYHKKGSVVKVIGKNKSVFTKCTNVSLHNDDLMCTVSELTRKDGKVIYPRIEQIQWNGKQFIFNAPDLII